MSESRPAESDCLAGAPHPRFTERLFGQDAAEERFLAAVRSGRILHAWLVTGPSGVGKATLTWRIAKYLMVRAHEERTGAGQDPAPDSLDVNPDHPAARRVRALSEPCLSLVRRPFDAERKRFKAQIAVDDIRALGEQFALSPPDGQPLLAVIDSADDMNAFAANALLKLLEEPPANAFMFLISHSPDRLLPTIRSRCGFLRCRPLAAADLKLAAEATGACQVKDAAALAELAGGSVGSAVQLHANEGIEMYRRLVKIISGAPGLRRDQAFSLASECGGRGAETQYASAVKSILMLLSRLAGTAAGIKIGEAVSGERRCLSRLGAAGSARTWSALNSDLAGRAQHAREVNIDPASVVLDMLFAIDRTAAELDPAGN